MPWLVKVSHSTGQTSTQTLKGRLFVLSTRPIESDTFKKSQEHFQNGQTTFQGALPEFDTANKTVNSIQPVQLKQELHNNQPDQVPT